MSVGNQADLSPGADEQLGRPAPPVGKGNRLVWLADHLEAVVTALLLMVMIASVCVGVFYRYILSQPLAWTEEIVLACMVWVVMLGASLATKSREHIVIDVVLMIVPRAWKRGMEVVALVVMISVLTVLAWQGFILVDRTRFMTTTALQMPTGIMYAAVPVAAVLMVIHNLRHLYRDLRGNFDTEVHDGVR